MFLDYLWLFSTCLFEKHCVHVGALWGKIYVELYYYHYYLWCISSISCFISVARLLPGTCCSVCVLCVTHPWDRFHSLTVPACSILLWLACHPFNCSRIRQKIFTQLLMSVRKWLFTYSVVLDLLHGKQRNKHKPIYHFINSPKNVHV